MHRLLLILVVAAAALVRLPQIYGDPPAGDISRSAAFLADEGIHGHNALHMALLGEWYIKDGFNPGVNTPVFMLFEIFLLKTFGVSLATVRYGAVFCGIIALLLFYRLLRTHSRRVALIGSLFWAVAYPLVIYQRLAFIENLLLCVLLAVGLVWLKALNSGRPDRWIPVFAALFVLGYLTKPTVSFILPAAIAAAWFHLPAVAERLRIAALTAFWLLIFGVILYVFWVSPYYEDWMYYQQLNMTSQLPQTVFQLGGNYMRMIGHLKFFEFMPILYTLALIQMLFLIGGKQTRPLSSLEKLLLCWFLIGFLFLGFFNYSPPRYSLVLMPAVLALAALMVDALLKNRDQIDLKLTGWAGYGLWLLLGLQVGFGLYRFFVDEQRYISCFLPLLGPAVFLALKYRRRSGYLAYGAVVLQLVQIGLYHQSMTFSLRDAMRDVARIIRETPTDRPAVLAGDSAMLLAFEARVPAVGVMYRQDRLAQIFARWRPNFLFLEDVSELPRLQRQIPDSLLQVTPIKQYTIMNNYAHGREMVLYRIQ